MLQWCDEGTLPTIQALREKGPWATIRKGRGLILLHPKHHEQALDQRLRRTVEVDLAG